MKQPSPSKSPNGRGRPRSAEIQEAIHSAFLEEMQDEGYNSVSIDSVARRAGISRTTIYRWYKDKDEIALEIAEGYVQQPDLDVPSGDYQSDIREYFSRTFDNANARGPLFTALMARAQCDKEFAQRVWTIFSKPRRELLDSIIEQNQASSRKGFRRETLLDLIFGAIWYRMMSGHAALDNEFVEELCAMIDELQCR